MPRLLELLRDGPVSINLGLVEFAEALEAQEAPVVHVDWTPPPLLDEETKAILDELL